MSPAPRKVSDDEVFAAAHRAMSRVGPRELSLTLIAEEAGVTASALVQRFGSKRALLAALADQAASSSSGVLQQLRQAHGSPLDAIRAYADCMGDLATSPAALARNLAYLQTDLTDPELRAALRKQALATRRELRRLLRDAVDARELKRETPVETLSRTLEHVVAGALLTWAIHQQGSAKRWVRAAVDSALEPYR